MNNKQVIKSMLDRHRGKFGSVKFTKRDGSQRSMNFRQGVTSGGTTPLKEGKWSNSDAKPIDYDLILCTDVDKEKKKEHSRRSFKLDSVTYLKIGGEVFEV